MSTMSTPDATPDATADETLRTAARHATRKVPLANPDDRADSVLAALRGQDFDSAAVVAVCVGERLVGLVTIERLLAAPPDAGIRSIMDANPPMVGPQADQEKAAWQAFRHGEPGLAVVDAEFRFLGLIPPQQLLGVLLEEHDEDLARLGGYLRATASARTASVESVARRLWHRLPWLALGLVGAMASAILMGVFEAELEANILVAFFLPGIVYLADAVGTQSETLAIRGLSVGIGIRRVARLEAWTGLLVGLLLAAVIFPLIALGWGDARVAAAVSIAVAAASMIATLIALTLPSLLNRLGRDPAFGSGPLATVIQDVLSIAIYFVTVAVFLSSP